MDKNLWSNIDHLAARDEVKFVIGSREDYEWAREQTQKFALPERCGCVLFSPVFGALQPAELARWILASGLPVRLQLQAHKYIWSPDTRGV